MPENRFAILIGTSSYKLESGLPNLRCPEKDVDGLAEVLSSGGGEFTELIPLKNQTSDQVMDKLVEIFTQAKRDDLVFIYYSGHGKQSLNGQLYLTTSDTLTNPPLRLKSTAIAVQDIYDLINQSSVNKVILLLDCCYSGAAGRVFKSDITTLLETLAQSEGRGIYVVSSSTETQVSLEKEDDEYSLMTKHIIQALSNGAALADEEGFIRINSLYNHIRIKVEEESHQRPMQFVLKREGHELIVARISTTQSIKQKIVLLYKRGAEPDEKLLDYLRTQLINAGCEVFFDLNVKVGMHWAKEINERIQAADAAIPLISKASIKSDILPIELQVARESQRKTGKPRILPVRVQLKELLPNTENWTEVSALLDAIQYVLWESEQDNIRVVDEILSVLQQPEDTSIDLTQLEAVGGAVPFDSRYYIVRSTDNDFLTSIKRRDGIVLIKGARQMGKTSLLQRGLNLAEKKGAKVVFVDFQTFNTSQFETIDKFYQVMCYKLAKSLNINLHPKDTWDYEFAGPNDNFNDFVKKVLEQLDNNLVWGMDEVDRLFNCSYGTDVFGNFRAWYNDRANPNSIWRKLTLAMAYATEAYLFIHDLDQSPFNVGKPLTLSDFTKEQVESLNKLYGSPLKTQQDLEAFYTLFAGQPYLVRLGLDEMALKKFSFEKLKELAISDEEPFGNHLRRFLILLAHDEELCNVMRTVLGGGKCPTEKSFYRLRSAGLMSGPSLKDGRIRCLAYAKYLESHLATKPSI